MREGAATGGMRLPAAAPSWRQNEETPLVGSGASSATTGFNLLNATMKPIHMMINPKAISAELWFAEKMSLAKALGVFAEVDELTPARAEFLLSRNDKNRPLSREFAEEIASMMASGDWALNGESVVISETGELNDGQHRCAGAVRAGVSLPCVLVWGVTRKSRETVDKGRRRLYMHTLSMRVETNSSVMSGALRYLTALLMKHSLQTSYSEPVLDRTLREHPDLHESIRIGLKCFTAASQPPTLGVAMHYLFARSDKAKANQFFESLRTGIDLSANNPILRLRNRLEQDAKAKARLDKNEVAALVIKAWNAYKAGKTSNLLKWASTGPTAEKFPEIM